jgi:endonuclease YncB( thermonuclease family)
MKGNRRSAAIIVLCAAAFACQPDAAELTGRVSHVSDGDSFVLDGSGRQDVRVRIARIDAPEQGQPHGDEARAALRTLIHRKKVRVEVDDTDDYGRLVGYVYVGEIDVGERMVAQGHAWAFRRYEPSRSLRDLEQAARAAKRGLWRAEDPVPPWEWRARERRRASTQNPECRIKGNINSRGVKIYHVPGSEHYDETRISMSRGERWFCTPAEARAAGWRAARSR